VQELLDIKRLEQDMVKKIREKSRNAIIVQAIEREENKNNNMNELLGINGMTKELSRKLEKHGIITRNDLAELDADSLNRLDLKELNDYDSCANLIMSAREHWFNEDK
jgi:N utilization substance protein A